MTEKVRGATRPTILRHLLPIAAILLLVAVLISPVAAELEGDGTADNPYLIKTADDLNQIRNSVVNTGVTDTTNKDGAITTINSQVINGYFKLANNLDMSSVDDWMPIGMTSDNTGVRWKIAFVGTFDGGGFTISNFTSSATSQGNGLFTRIGAGGTVKDLKFYNCTSGVSDSIDVGVLCGSTWGATISNIELQKITINGKNCVGTLCGYINQVTQEETIIPTIIRDCKASDSTVTGGDSTGGLVGNSAPGSINNQLINCEVSNTKITSNGQSAAGLVAAASGTLTNCHAKNVEVTLTTTSGTTYIGGLAALCYASSIDGCSSSGSVKTTNGGIVSYSGGLVGSCAKSSKINEYEIKNSNSSANVEVTANNAGGLIGGIATDISFKVSDCYATGNVKIANKATDHLAGGLIGESGIATITNSFATGSVTSSEANLITNGELGGLIGSSSGTLTDCYATGTVTANAGYTGGLVGKFSGTSVTNCYATGDVTGKTNAGGLFGEVGGTVKNSYATGDVSGTDYTGGFAGVVSSGSTIQQCASSGDVSASSDGENGYAGGFVGKFFANSKLENAIATGTVSGKTAGGFVGVADAGMTSCYVNSTSNVPFTGSYTGQYSPQNCFWTDSVTGMLSSGEPNGSASGVNDYYYAKMTFADCETFVEEIVTIKQENTIGTSATDKTPKHTLTVKVNPENIVDVDTMTAATLGSGTVSLVMTVNGKDFVFGTMKVDVKAAITFDANGGTGTMADQIVTTSDTVALDENKFTREGDYEFTGWNTKADGTGDAYSDKEKLTVTKNLTLYAQWLYTETEIEPAMPGVAIDDTGKTTISDTADFDMKISPSDDKTAIITDPATGTEISVTFANSIGSAGDSITTSVSEKVESVQVTYTTAKTSEPKVDYTVSIDMKNLTTSLPTLSSEFKTTVKDNADKNKDNFISLAMITASSADLEQINGNITQITLIFSAEKTLINQYGKDNIYVMHMDKDGNPLGMPKAALIGETTTHYKFKATGTSFSSYVLGAVKPVQNQDSTPSSSPSSSGSSVWLMETQTPTPTETPTENPTPTDVAPTDFPSTQPTEAESPAPLLAVLAGLGAVAVLRRK